MAATATTQLTLWEPPATTSNWDDVRVPRAYFDHYKRTGKCLNCRADLRHPMHAFNHYRKFHIARPKAQKPQYFVWNGQKFVREPRRVYLAAKRDGRATAHTKILSTNS